DIALEYNYQSGNASNYDAGNEENESGNSMVANVEFSQEENANLNASMQSNKSSEREISIVLSNDGHNPGLDAPTQLVKPNEITSQIATQEQCLNDAKLNTISVGENNSVSESPAQIQLHISNISSKARYANKRKDCNGNTLYSLTQTKSSNSTHSQLNDKQDGYIRQRFYQNNNANQSNYNNNQQQPIPTRITTRKRVKN
ncbi:Hypothetical predicted protein, partial [Paramuricea clavata]